MLKYRPYLLGLVSLVLTGLVWLDNQDFLLSLFGGASTSLPPPRAAVVERSKIDNHVKASKMLSSSAAILVSNPLVSIDKSSLANWVSRPLFAPSRRRPPPQAAPAQAAAAKPPPDYALIGVILNPVRTVAILRSVSSGANLHVEVGDTLSGWKVATVERNTVTLVRENDPEQIIHFKTSCASGLANCP